MKKKGAFSHKNKLSHDDEDDYEPPTNLSKRIAPYLTRNHKSPHSKPSKKKEIHIKKEEEYKEEDEDEYEYEDEDEDFEIPITKKLRVQKYYEPIVDNDKTYKYSEDPYEYKRARKYLFFFLLIYSYLFRRIQNRESATRVRIKKRMNTVELKQKVGFLEHEVLDLKSQNASLNTENSMLKQQMYFFEKMIMEQQKDKTIDLDPFMAFSPNME